MGACGDVVAAQRIGSHGTTKSNERRYSSRGGVSKEGRRNRNVRQALRCCMAEYIDYCEICLLYGQPEVVNGCLWRAFGCLGLLPHWACTPRHVVPHAGSYTRHTDDTISRKSSKQGLATEQTRPAPPRAFVRPHWRTARYSTAPRQPTIPQAQNTSTTGKFSLIAAVQFYIFNKIKEKAHRRL